MQDDFDADYEREQIRKLGAGMNKLATHWSYLGNFRSGKNSGDFRSVANRLQRLCGMKEPDDEPDFEQNMEGKSLRSLERSVDAAIKSLKKYQERHNSFWGFLGRLFNIVNYAREQDSEIALRRLQEMKNSIVRLKSHDEGLNGPEPAQRVQVILDKTPEIKKAVVEWQPSKKVQTLADQFEEARKEQAAQEKKQEAEKENKKTVENKATENKVTENKVTENKKVAEREKVEAAKAPEKKEPTEKTEKKEKTEESKKTDAVEQPKQEKTEATKQEPKPEQKPESKKETKTEAKSEIKPEPKSETKSKTKPETEKQAVEVPKSAEKTNSEQVTNSTKPKKTETVEKNEQPVKNEKPVEVKQPEQKKHQELPKKTEPPKKLKQENKAVAPNVANKQKQETKPVKQGTVTSWLLNLFPNPKKPKKPIAVKNPVASEPKKTKISILEEKFRNLSPIQRSEAKNQFAAKEFLPDYGRSAFWYGPENLNSNDIQTLKNLDKRSGKKDPQLHNYLNHRIQNLEKINKLEQKAAENFQKRQAKEPEIVRDNQGEITKIMVPDVTQPEMQHTQNGCWSVALSSLLRHKGVDIDQENIRSFRPDTNENLVTAQDILYMNEDKPNSIGMFRELVFKTIPDTAVNEVRGEVLNAPRSEAEAKGDWQFHQWTNEQKENQIPEVVEKLRTVIKRGLEADKGPVAILVQNHYRTIYGIEKTTDQYGNEVEMLHIHDPNDPNCTRMSLLELAGRCYKREYNNGQVSGEGYSFDAQWLQDLTDDKGQLSLSKNMQDKGVNYVNHKLQCPNLMKTGQGSPDHNNGERISATIENDLILNTYLPSTIKNLAKNRVKAPFNQADLHNSNKPNAVNHAKKNTLHTKKKEQAKKQQVKKPPVMKGK